MTEAIILSIIGSGALFSFVTFLITRHDNNKKAKAEKESQIAELNERMLKAEKDTVRTQLLLLMSDYADNAAEILQVGEYYFRDLQGDWYMTTLYNNFLIQKGIAKPEWLSSEN